MPVYEYKCQNEACQMEFEEFYTSFSAAEKEEPLAQCPKCSSTKKVRKVPTATSFQLKGRGWAKDRYGR